LILVLTGTNPYSFHRLVEAVDAWEAVHRAGVLVQLGHTRVEPRHCRFQRFFERERLQELIGQADLVICQGGFGSLRDCLSAGKRVVAAPRDPRRGESVDDQEEIVRALDRAGRLVGLYDVRRLDEAIRRAARLDPPSVGGSRIPQVIHDYVAALSLHNDR